MSVSVWDRSSAALPAGLVAGRTGSWDAAKWPLWRSASGQHAICSLHWSAGISSISPGESHPYPTMLHSPPYRLDSTWWY